MENSPINKYFKPLLEDLKIGYEGEFNNWCMDERGHPELNYNRWEKAILTKENIETIFKYGIKGFRVPYLTKEQIRDNGWKVIIPKSNLTKEGVFFFEKGNHFLVADFSRDTPFLEFILRDPSKEERVNNPERFRFFCYCKDINTFKDINKLLENEQLLL